MLARTIGLATLMACGAAHTIAAQTRSEIETAIDGLEWRSIGPAEMGGRTTDIAAIPGDPLTVYFATASGGVWKTTDGAITWSPIFETGGTLSVGALALAPSDHNVLYVGTGEGNPRNSTSIGDGVYRSTDAGGSFEHIGLTDTERISRIRVHPTDPDIVYVGAMGHLWGPNTERGVYRSTDGGDTWERVLYVDENTGVADLALDPSNPRILYAALWDFRRQPWTFRSGGPGSGLYRSTDGGTTWERLTDGAPANGLPAGELGRIGLAIAESNPRTLFAIIESEAEGVLWRSDDRGETWTLVSSSAQIAARPFYYHDIRVDPTDEHTLFALASGLSKSIDGGRTWRRIATNIHGDHHALWIDPENPDRVINGNDGGFHFSPDGGETWEFSNTVPLAQFYQIAADNDTPYNVCGGLQDNDAWCGPSRTTNVAGSLLNYWHEIIGPGDGMYVQFDPRDPDVMYANMQGGNFSRIDLSTGESRSISPYPVPSGALAAGVHEYRFNWNAPIHLSPHDPDVLYVAGNVVFRSDDEGHSWTEISPDLTRAEQEKLGLSGGITLDNTTAEYHASVYTLSESPVEAGVIWAGTDDGNLQLTRDGGSTWTELSARLGAPDGAWVSRVEASKHSAGTAFVTLDRHREDDMAPYVFGTNDYGNTWVDLSVGLPTPGYAHVVREDPRVPGLLYLGTETGVWFSHAPSIGSVAEGREWASLRLGLPPVPVRDLLVHPRDNDIVLGTHGRGVWVLDDAAPIQELPSALAAGGPYLFEPVDAIRFEPSVRRFRFDIGDGVFVGENPPYGARFTYWIPDVETDLDAGRGTDPDTDMDADPEDPDDADPELEILDAARDVIRTIEVSGEPGLHRVAWDLRYEAIDDAKDGYRFSDPGPKAPPGSYTGRLMVDGQSSEASVTVVLDPRLPASAAGAARAQFDAMNDVGALATEVASAVRELDSAREQLVAWQPRLENGPDAQSELAATASDLIDRADSIRVHLAWPADETIEMFWMPVSPGLRSIYQQMGRSTHPPTATQLAWLERYRDRWIARGDELEAWRSGLERFNADLSAAGLDRVRRDP